MEHRKRILIGQITLILVLAIVTGMLVSDAVRKQREAALPPPRVIHYQPGAEEEMRPDQPVEIVFDRPMVRASVEQAITTEPAFEHTVTWVDDTTLRVTPARPLQRDTAYTITIGKTAADQTGAHLADPAGLRLHTLGYLKVTDAVPAEGSTSGAGKELTIAVSFNRPVVPLSADPSAGDLARPLRFTPDIPGRGEWVNTSLYLWRPDTSLASGQKYQVSVDPSLKTFEHVELDHGYTWDFSTRNLDINEITPTDTVAFYDYSDNRDLALLDTAIRVSFTQPVDRASAEAAFALRQDGSEQNIGGTFAWDEGSTTMTFTPSALLSLATKYSASITPNLRDEQGRPTLKAGRSTAFETLPYPAVTEVYPEGDQTIKDIYNDRTYNATVRFGTLMDHDSLVESGRVTITPEPLRPVQLDVWPSYGSPYTTLVIRTYFASNTTYTITVNPGAKDIYGNVVTEPYTWSFKTRTYGPRVDVNMVNTVTMVDASQPARVMFTTENLPSIDLHLVRVKPDILFAHNSFYYNFAVPADHEEIREWTYSPGAPSDTLKTEMVSMTADDSPLPAGVYLLTADGPVDVLLSRQTRLLSVLVVSNVHITLKQGTDKTLAWVTDLRTGQPVEGAHVEYRPWNNLKDTTPIGSGDTGPDGSVSLDASSGEMPTAYDIYRGERDAYALVDRDGLFGVAALNWSVGIGPYDFGLPYTDRYNGRPDEDLYLYTDRPIYRPGQQVSYRGILRRKDDMALTLPQEQSVTVNIYPVSQDGNQSSPMAKQNVLVDEFGSFDGTFTLPADAPLGRYTINVETKGKKYTGYRANWWYYNPSDTSFQVEDYHKPQYEVTLTPDSPDLLSGQTISAASKAAYYFGAPVANAKVEWGIWHHPTEFQYAGSGRYEFGDSDRYWYFENQDDYYSMLGWDNFSATGKGTTTSEGDFSFKMPQAATGASTGPERYTIQATVSDGSASPVTATAEVTVHNARYYVGVQRDDYFVVAGQPAHAQVIAVDWDSKPTPGQYISAQLVQVVYNRVRYFQEGETGPQWKWTVEETPVGSPVSVITGQTGTADVSLVPPGPGNYKIKATITDPDGRQQTSAAFLWVTGSGYARWRSGAADDQTDIVLDQPGYKPGDTATLLIANPFQGKVRALVTFERMNVMRHEVITLEGGAAKYQFTVMPDLAPNAFISVVLIKGVDETNAIPDFKMGMVEITVQPVEKLLNVTVTPGSDSVGPGETASFDVAVTDYQGKPARAEVSLALVDEAVLALKEEVNGDIVQGFYDRQGLSVYTAIPMTALIDRLLADVIPPGPCECGGGGPSGAPDQANDSVRQDFRDTAFWRGDVVTGADGRASVTVKLPDNLTRWRMDARAVTRDTQVGRTNVSITASKQLLIRPLVPRFFVEGDQAQLIAVVNNNTDTDVVAQAGLDATGVTLGGPAAQTVTVPARGQIAVTWPATIDQGSQWVGLVFHASGGGYTDSVKPETGDPDHDRMIPVHRYEGTPGETQIVVGTSGQIAGGGTRTEGIYLPQGLQLDRGNVALQIDPSLAATTLDGLTWLKHYPYECNEQLTSKFLPNAITLKIMHDLGVKDPELERGLTAQIEVAIKKLASRQNSDGGWGYWPEDKSNAMVTTYALQGLILARQAGILIDRGMLGDASDYVKRSLSYYGLPDERANRNRLAYSAYVLSLDGPNSVGTIDLLYDNRDGLDYYARALLAQAIHENNPADPRLEALRSDLVSAARITSGGVHWEEKQVDYWNWNTDVRSTAVILDTMTRLWPDQDLNPQIVRWLMAARDRDHWATTQETVWSLIGLSDWMAASGELKAGYDWQVILNGNPVGTGKVSPDTVRQRTALTLNLDQLRAGALNTLAMSRTDGPGRMYYSAYLTAYPTVDKLAPIAHGVSVERRILDAQGKPVTEGKVGDELTVQVSVTTSQDMKYMLIEDFLPAGAEVINPDLLTESHNQPEPSAGYADPEHRGWGWWNFSHIELHDDRIALSAEELGPGSYMIVYRIRLTTPGEYRVLPASAYEFYFPDVYGRGAGSVFTVRPAQ